MLSKFDSFVERCLHRELTKGERVHSGVCTGVSSEIQNHLIECIDSVIQDQIDKEIENCRFLSIQVDETTDVSTKEQLSVIIRLDREVYCTLSLLVNILVRDLVRSEEREGAGERITCEVCERWRGRVRRNINILVKVFHIKYIFGKIGLL